MILPMCAAVLGGLLLYSPLSLAQAEQTPNAQISTKCTDAVFAQTEARILQRSSVAEQIRGWEEFLALHPDNPCSYQAQRYLQGLKNSDANKKEQDADQSWRQEARGGVVEPNQQQLPSHAIFPDAFPVDRARLLSEIVWLGQHWKSEHGEENRKLTMDRDSVWTLVLRGDLALVSHFGLMLDVPVVVGEPGQQDLQGALGNIALGIKGIWGTKLGEDSLPWVISAGIVWGTGSSVFSGQKKAPILNAAAVGSAYMRHLYLYDSPDYAIHAESQLGLGRHALGLALAYHIFAGGEHVEKILRFDLSWDWSILTWATIGIEMDGGLGTGEPVVGAVENEFLFYVYAAPVFRMQFGKASAAVALRIPMGDAWGWSKIISSIELSWGF